MDGSGTSGQYLPVVTIGADGQLKAVTDPTCLPNHGNTQPVDVGEEVGINFSCKYKISPYFLFLSYYLILSLGHCIS